MRSMSILSAATVLAVSALVISSSTSVSYAVSPNPSTCSISGIKDAIYPRGANYGMVCNRCIRAGNGWFCTNAIIPEIILLSSGKDYR